MMNSKQALAVILDALAHYPNAAAANMAGKWAQSMEAECQELRKTNRRLQANNDLLREKLLANGYLCEVTHIYHYLRAHHMIREAADG